MAVSIDQLLKETRRFQPSQSFVDDSLLSSNDRYQTLYQESIEQPDLFWSGVAQNLHWFKPWSRILDKSRRPFFRWFVDAQTNVSYNCLV